MNIDDYNLKIPAMLWAYRTKCKKLTGKKTFRSVYGKEAIMPMEYIVPSLRTAIVTYMADLDIMNERIS